MMLARVGSCLSVAFLVCGLAGWTAAGPTAPPDDDVHQAVITGIGPDWKVLNEADFQPVNGKPDTWKWTDGLVHCTGDPVGVTRTRKAYRNFELVAEYRHLKSAGNSGVFVWASEQSLENLQPGQLPRGGIEVQVLDHGYREQYEKESGKPGDWFSTDGDIFPVGTSKMTPFPPTSPDGSRGFPREKRARGVEKWNHYYIRAINGEIRLWVNGVEVSGGKDCVPAEGYLCLESEGSPVEFRAIRIRELP